jgi:hypothetical protein
MLLAAYILAYPLLVLHMCETVVISVVVVISVFWGMVSFRLVNDSGGAWQSM